MGLKECTKEKNLMMLKPAYEALGTCLSFNDK